MKITFIKPNIGRKEDYLYVDRGRMEPLQLGVLAGMTPDHIEKVMFDDRMEEIDFDDKTDLVAITVETYTARRAYEISLEYRARGIPVIMGGFHPTLIPEECSQYADSIMIGDAGWMWQEVLDDFQEYKKLKPVYKSKVGVGQANIYYPDRSIFKGKGYLNIALTQFSRGCKFACSFCAISSFFDKQHFTRDVDKVVTELKRVKAQVVFFVDDNICNDREALKELLKALIPLKIRWISQGTMDMVKDLELMDLMRRSGCLGIVVGFETINRNNLGQLRKGPNKIQIKQDFDKAYSKEIDIMRDFGLQNWAAFTLGYDFDTPESIDETVDWAISKKFAFGAFNVITVYPNTPLYNQMKEQGRLLYDDKWWLHPSYRFNHATFKPKLMTPDQLTAAGFRSRKRWSEWKSILYRLMDHKTHLRTPMKAALYMKYNPLYRAEALEKHDMYFGNFNHLPRGEENFIHTKDDLLVMP